MGTVIETIQTLQWSRLTGEQIYFSPDDLSGPFLAVISVVKRPPFGYQFCQPENCGVTLTQERYGEQRNQAVTSVFSMPSKL